MILAASALAAVLPRPASAAVFTDFDAALGFSSIGVEAGTAYEQTMESLSTLELNYNFNFQNMDTSLNLSFQEMLDSTYGPLAFTRFAVGGRWYPMGMNGERVLMDNGAWARTFSTKPFISITGGLGTLSVVDGDVNFNAVMVDVAFRLGLELPIGTHLVSLVQAGYLLAIDSLAETQDEAQQVKYGGLNIMVGLRLTRF